MSIFDYFVLVFIGYRQILPFRLTQSTLLTFLGGFPGRFSSGCSDVDDIHILTEAHTFSQRSVHFCVAVILFCTAATYVSTCYYRESNKLTAQLSCEQCKIA